MRNYIKELVSSGFSIDELVKETGLSKNKLNGLKNGKIKLSSKATEYETVRNTSRRLGYRLAKDFGADEFEATKSRRNIFSSKAPKPQTKQRRVKTLKEPKTNKMYQLYIIGLFRHEESEEEKIQKGLSTAHKKKNYEIQLKEAVNYARSQLEGSNWILEQILYQRYTEYMIV